MGKTDITKSLPAWLTQFLKNAAWQIREVDILFLLYNIYYVAEVTAKHTYKASMFEMIFSNEKELLSLYNGVNETDYADPGLLEVNTLENAKH